MSRYPGTRRNQSHEKFDGDWRYVPADTWRLDLEARPESPEDDIIRALDGAVESEKADIWVFLNNALSDKRAVNIIYSYLWIGDSMESIGEDLGLTRQRVWQLYKAACKELSQTLSPSEFKQMFIS